jgi:hypothetical protein
MRVLDFARQAFSVVFPGQPTGGYDYRLVTIPGECDFDRFRHPGVQRIGAAKLANPLLAFPRSQVARSCGTMFDFTVRGQAKTLLCAFMSLLLGHGLARKSCRITYRTVAGSMGKGEIYAIARPKFDCQQPG